MNGTISRARARAAPDFKGDDDDTDDTSSQETIRRGDGRFLPGVSGNPGGRSPTRLSDGRSLRDIARDHTEAAIGVLATTMADDTAPAMARVSASVALLDRGWGKSAQFVETVNLGLVSGMSDIERAAKLAALIATVQLRTGRGDPSH